MKDFVYYVYQKEDITYIHKIRKGAICMGILIRQGRIIDAATKTDKVGDIYIEDGIIREIGDK